MGELSESQEVKLEIRKGNGIASMRAVITKVLPGALCLKLTEPPLVSQSMAPGAPIRINFSNESGIFFADTFLVEKYQVGSSVLMVEKPLKVTTVKHHAQFKVPVEIITSVVVVKSWNPSLASPIPHEVTTKELSGAGLLFHSDLELSPNDNVRVHLHLRPDWGVELEGRITQKKYLPPSAGLPRSYQVEFTDVSPRTEDRIVAYLFEVQRKRRAASLDAPSAPSPPREKQEPGVLRPRDPGKR